MTKSAEGQQEIQYRISFMSQTIYAKSIEDVVEKINKHKDAIPFSISTREREVAQWRKYEGIRIIEPMKICSKHNRQLDHNGTCRDCGN